MDIFKLPIYYAADVFPMMSDAELTKLAADIKEHSLLEPLVIATVDGNELAPFDIVSGETVTLRLLFKLPLDADPAELKYDVLDYISFPRLGETIVYEFR